MKKTNQLTGYPSIDKPQNKYYRKTPIRKISIEQTIYDLVFVSNRKNMNDIAIGYLGTNITFKELKNKTDRAAHALYQQGIREGDVILIGVSNSPEAVIVLLALNKLGAISKWFDVRASEKDIEKYANDSNCKYTIIFDMLIPKINMIINRTSLQHIIIINPTDSLSYIKQILFKIKSKITKNFFCLPKDSRFILFKDLLKKNKSKTYIPTAKFNPQKPSIMIQSSGTTGKPKTIVHSDLSCTSCTAKIAYSDIPFGRGKTSLVLLPPWIAYGLGNAIILPMALGSKVELSPIFSPEAIMQYLGKFTLAFAAPFNYRYLRDSFDTLTEKQKEMVKKIECLISGGDKISVEENKNFEKLFGTKLINGYGNNECWGALTVNPVLHNKYGTVGIPKYGDTIIAYDNITGQELSYGKIGEICTLSDTAFLYYENNSTNTNTVKKIHKDGHLWIHTGDLGFIDKNGYITLSGRIQRVIVRLGFKIAAYTIEDKICEHTAVKECVAIAVKDIIEESVPMVYIILKDEYKNDIDQIKKKIFQKCTNELKQYEIPKYFRFVESLPYTQNGKYNFKLLEQEGNKYVKTLETT